MPATNSAGIVTVTLSNGVAAIAMSMRQSMIILLNR
jgi:hypothetical protein